MKWMKLFFSMLIFAALTTPVVSAAVTTGAPAPDFTLMDSKGQELSLSEFRGKYVVLEWVNYDCPFVRKHYQSGNMQQLQKTYTDKGVIWLSVNSSAEGKQGAYSPTEANQIMDNAGASPTAYLLDTPGEVGRQYGAQTTPHMFVINPEGVLIYQGAIDSIPSFDQADIPKATNYVAAVLDAAMVGEPVAIGATKAYGCSVKY